MMKKIFFTFVVLAVISCSKEEKNINYAVFSGKIENVDGRKLIILSSENKMVKEIIVNEDGTFIDTLKNIDLGYYSFRYANESSEFFLRPGYNLKLLLDPKEFDESIIYSGKGEAENNYLAKKYLNEEDLGQLRGYDYLASLDEKSFLHKMDSIKQLENKFLDQQLGLNADFKSYENSSIQYNWLYKLKIFEFYKRFILKDKNFKVSENYPNFEKDLNLEDENLLVVNSYKNFLNEYFLQKAGDFADKNNIERDIAFLQVVVKEVKSPKIKEQLLYGAAKYGVTYTKELQIYYDIFMANSTDEEHKKDVSEKYNKLVKLSKGQASPKFTAYENFNGEETSLDDLKGKFVYVDVWATWCGPCKYEIPSLKKVEKKYHDKNIAFVSMSIDRKKDYDKWRKMVEEEELSGIQLFAPNDWNSDFVDDYGIMGIPRFILIDPEGNIVNANAPRPSSVKLIDLFNELGI
jgi:thiol-disulfide isomerase/thioredoxin